MTIKSLRESTGMSLTEFSKYFGIPYRTVQNWELNIRQCPDYLLKLMEYKLLNENLIQNKEGIS